MHIYTAKNQPATLFHDDCSGKRMTFTNAPKSLVWVGCCQRKRRADGCVVQCFYDGLNFWCAPSKGCKSEREIKAKRNKEFRNRSAAAKLGWEARRYTASN